MVSIPQNILQLVEWNYLLPSPQYVTIAKYFVSLSTSPATLTQEAEEWAEEFWYTLAVLKV